MKLRHLPSLCAALLALCPTLATAQTSAVPGFISYQGRVVDSTGANVGAVTPVNRTVIFRIWDNPSSTATANLIYSEAQTVTVSDGEFSVLVGQGVANTTQTFGYSEAGTDKKLADFSTAFTGSARYLGVTVASAATIATTDNEITPRQQIVSTAFAMRAKFAESIGSASDLTLTPLSGTASNYGLGWYGTARPFGTTAVDGPVLYGNAGGALGSNVSGSQNTALRWDANGRVGIGATSIASSTNKLTLQGDMATTPGDQLTIRGNADNNKRLLLGYDTTANKASLQSYTALTTAGTLLLNPSGGYVGVNNTSPLGQLTVNSGNSAFTIGDADPTTGAWIRNSGDQAVVFSANADNMYFGYGGKAKTLSFMGGGSIAAMTINNACNVGIGAQFPTEKLEVAGNIKATGTITASTSIVAGTSISANGTNGHTFAGTGDTDGGLFSPADGTVTLKANNIERVRVNSAGIDINMTEGTIEKGAGAGGFTIGKGEPLKGGWIRNNGDGNVVFSSTSGDMYFGYNGSSKQLHFMGGGSTDAMTITSTGRVAIGTSDPLAPLHVVGDGGAYTFNLEAYLDGFGAKDPNGADVSGKHTIIANGRIRADRYDVSSDLRIKNVQKVSEGREDLATLMKIEITDYLYKDVVANGTRPQKKVIAQQVEVVYPQAVSQTTEVVPDLYQKAAVKDGWVELATNLKVGERVKLVGKTGQSMHEVLAVRDGAFRPDGKMDAEQVFVYGREAKDFRVVDYDAIAMLNVSATQQVKREKDAEIQTLRDENAVLRRELAAKDASLETRLIALERRMSAEGATETVSLKTAQAVK